jgi:hypothetical protein
MCQKNPFTNFISLLEKGDRTVHSVIIMLFLIIKKMEKNIERSDIKPLLKLGKKGKGIKKKKSAQNKVNGYNLLRINFFLRPKLMTYYTA